MANSEEPYLAVQSASPLFTKEGNEYLDSLAYIARRVPGEDARRIWEALFPHPTVEAAVRAAEEYLHIAYVLRSQCEGLNAHALVFPAWMALRWFRPKAEEQSDPLALSEQPGTPAQEA